MVRMVVMWMVRVVRVVVMWVVVRRVVRMVVMWVVRMTRRDARAAAGVPRIILGGAM